MFLRSGLVFNTGSLLKLPFDIFFDSFMCIKSSVLKRPPLMELMEMGSWWFLPTNIKNWVLSPVLSIKYRYIIWDQSMTDKPFHLFWGSYFVSWFLPQLAPAPCNHSGNPYHFILMLLCKYNMKSANLFSSHTVLEVHPGWVVYQQLISFHCLCIKVCGV